MTTTRYILARLAQAFGYVRKNQRLTEASAEMHLLREAETYLGMRTWENVEHIESLSVEYWNLRKLMKERIAVDGKIEECRKRLDAAHEERASLLNGMPEENEELLGQRNELLKSLEQLAIRRDSVVAEAREVRRRYTGLKTKLEVLVHERGGEPTSETYLRDVDRLKQSLREVRGTFELLKVRREEVGRQIEEGDRQLDELDAQLKAIRQERRAKAAEAFQIIGEMNKELSKLRAESGLLEARMRQLFSEVGRHLSLNDQQKPCAEAVKKERSVVDVMHALRKSVKYNHKLAGTAR